jgi:hypothetical protein
MNRNHIFLGLLFSVCLVQAASAGTKPALRPRSAALQCVDRKIDLKASCYEESGYPGLSCTSQRLSIIDSASGREIGGQSYKPAPLQAGDAYPIVAEKVSDVICAETQAKQKVVVAKVSNGGNCAQCEWADVYAWDGTLIGSDRDKNKKTEVGEAVKAAFDKKARKLGQGDLSGVYFASEAVAEEYSPFGLSCVAVGHAGEREAKVSASLDKRYAALWGKDWIKRPTPPQTIDPKAMEEIAAIAGCAAMMDQDSCSSFYDPEFGGEVSIFSDMSTKVPLRRQFNAAIAALPDERPRKAAQYCLKLVGKK